jgi:hypothetical protein
MSSTTESVESVQSLEATVDLEIVLAALKEFGCADLFKVIKMSTQEAEKRVKSGSKVKKEDGPKKPTPHQLQKPTAWVRFTLKHAQERGWEEFIVRNRKSGEEILMPASEEVDGKHVYPGGKEMILTHAMSLSKQRWAPKAVEGTNEELYEEFSAEFEAAAAAAAAEAPAEEAPEWLVPVIVRKTAEEKAAEVAAKKAQIEALNAEKKAERERAKEEAKAAKEAEKAAAKAAKVPKAAVKAAMPKAAVKAPVAAVKVAPKPTGKEEATTPRSLSAEPVKTPARKPATANATAAVWSCPADGAVHPWNYKGEKYLRNSDHQVWREDADGGCGDWCGVYVGGEVGIDNSVEEPDFE